VNPETPLVSIVLPTYKRAHVLPHAIRSVLVQTYGNWELIVVDDNSPDETAQGGRRLHRPAHPLREERTQPETAAGAELRPFAGAGNLLTWISDDKLCVPLTDRGDGGTAAATRFRLALRPPLTVCAEGKPAARNPEDSVSFIRQAGQTTLSTRSL
jgi:GT2 family glycosyltransferase